MIIIIEKRLSSLKLTKIEEEIKAYILANPSCVTNKNAKELAEEIEVSSASVVRFSQKMGYHGYPDFQIAYIKEYMLQNEKDYKLDKYSNMEMILDTIPAIYSHMIKMTKNLNDSDTFLKVIHAMREASQIDFYANDNNYLQVQSACLRLNMSGIRAQAFNTMNNDYIFSQMPENAIAFVVSHTGKNKTMLEVAAALRMRKIKVFALTGTNDLSLQKICYESLYLYRKEDEIERKNLTQSISLAYVLDSLLLGLFLGK